MKALSIHPIYASAIACGLKRIELRNWETSYTGDLLICSTKKDCDDRELKDLFMFGKALAVASLVGCTPFERSHRQFTLVDESVDNFELFGLKSWVLDNVRPIRPFDIKGQQRIFNVDAPQMEFLNFDVTTDDGAIALQDYWINSGYIKERPWD